MSMYENFSSDVNQNNPEHTLDLSALKLPDPEPLKNEGREQPQPGLGAKSSGEAKQISERESDPEESLYLDQKAKLISMVEHAPLREVAASLRSVCSNFIAENLHYSPEMGFNKELAESVDITSFRELLETRFIELRTRNVNNEDALCEIIDTDKLERLMLQRINSFLINLRGSNINEHVPEGKQSQLFLQVKELRAVFAAVMQEYEGALLALSGDTSDAGSKTEDVLDGQLVKRAREVLSGDDAGLTRMVQSVDEVLSNLSAEMQSQRSSMIGFVTAKGGANDQVRTEPIVEWLADTSLMLEDIFSNAKDQTPIGLQLRAFAQNMQSLLDEFRIVLCRDLPPMLGKADLPMFMSEVGSCHVAVQDLNDQLEGFKRELKSLVPDNAA